MNTTRTEVNTQVTTEETPATAPARHSALQSVADMTPRKLAHFHHREASELLSDIEHSVVCDYGDEDSEFTKGEAARMVSMKEKILRHLGHIEAIALESAQRGDPKALPAPKAD